MNLNSHLILLCSALKIAAIIAEGHGSTAGPVVYISGEEVSC